MKLSCSILFCLLVNFGFAQQEKKPDSLKVKFYPRSFRVGTDVISLVKTQTSSSFSGWEVNGDVDLGKYYFAVDYGTWGKKFDVLDTNNYQKLPVLNNYQNSGTYYRVGMDINLLKKDPDRNMFFIGFRYGHSAFTESATVNLVDRYFGTIQKQLNNTQATAGWGEMTLGLRVKIWKEFWMGYTARMKFALKVKGEEELKTYDVPGYGVNGGGFYWGFNYQIFYRIPFTKEKKSGPSFPK